MVGLCLPSNLELTPERQPRPGAQEQTQDPERGQPPAPGPLVRALGPGASAALVLTPKTQEPLTDSSPRLFALPGPPSTVLAWFPSQMSGQGSSRPLQALTPVRPSKEGKQSRLMGIERSNLNTHLILTQHSPPA